ncbi:MAG TPA: glycosyltransferase family 4 protein [Pyrinomonadaceae bacterium]
MDWHLITCEYPPRVGGVADHTRLVASGLAAEGDRVCVWCPAAEGEAPGAEGGVSVRRELGSLRPSDLRRAGRALNEFNAPRRLLVQWVPHGYGYRSMNVWLCLWLWARAFLRGDEVTLVVHEPFLAFGEGSRRQDAVALVHRVMTTLLLSSARRVWTTIPKWEERWRPYTLGRRVPFGRLPVPSTTPVTASAEEASTTRALYAPAGVALVGHFGTYGELIAGTLRELLPRLLSAEETGCAVLLIGQGSEAMREELLRARPELSGRIHAAGTLAPEALSRHLAACDLLVQPYPDGVSARRTSAMAGLAHGLAVVTTKGVLTESLWEESGAVALAPAGDVGALLDEVRRLLASPESRAPLGDAARKLYRERFDLSHTVASLRRAADERAEAAHAVGAGAEA